MAKIESELWSRGFHQNQNNNWTKESKIVQIAHYSQFQNKSIRVSWKETWKNCFALIFDYSSGGGPICVVPAQVFFSSRFVGEKRKMLSYRNSGFCWSQTFKLRDELPQLLLRYKDKWGIIDGKKDETPIIQENFPPQLPIPLPKTKVLKKNNESQIELKDFIDNHIQKRFNPLPLLDKKIITEVWNNRINFIKWPKEAILLFPGLVRPKSGFLKYSSDMIEKLKKRGVKIDTRTNGPAIMSFFYAGGERPSRRDCNKEWTIHHIYDGKFPFEIGKQTLLSLIHI